MPRIAFPTEADLPAEHRGIFEQIRRDRGRVSDLFRILAWSPEVLLRRLAFGESLRTKTILPARLRELAILTVARLNGGGFEFAAHVKIGRQAGVTDTQIAELAEFETSPSFGEQERAVMAYAAEVTQHVKVQDDTWGRVAAFLSHRELIELVLNVAWYNQTGRVTAPLQLQE